MQIFRTVRPSAQQVECCPRFFEILAVAAVCVQANQSDRSDRIAGGRRRILKRFSWRTENTERGFARLGIEKTTVVAS